MKKTLLSHVVNESTYVCTSSFDRSFYKQTYGNGTVVSWHCYVHVGECNIIFRHGTRGTVPYVNHKKYNVKKRYSLVFVTYGTVAYRSVRTNYHEKVNVQ